MSEKLSEYCRRQASRPCPEDYGFNVEWNLAADDALVLEARLGATERMRLLIDEFQQEAQVRWKDYAPEQVNKWLVRIKIVAQEEKE